MTMTTNPFLMPRFGTWLSLAGALLITVAANAQKTASF